MPPSWLSYAALDVEVLLDLRDAVAGLLEEQGKLGWAREEFAAVRDAPPPAPRQDPWRRTSGMHQIRSRRGLAVLRELWLERERVAERRDVAPGRVLPDRALVNAASVVPTSPEQLTALPVFSGPSNRRQAHRWLGAIERGRRAARRRPAPAAPCPATAPRRRAPGRTATPRPPRG